MEKYLYENFKNLLIMITKQAYGDISYQVEHRYVQQRTHNPFEESHWMSCLRENLTSSSDGEGLEMGQSVPHQSFTRQVFFKDAKQHLQLGKCQCNIFDSLIGAATLAMMQYLMLLLYKQMH